MNYATGGARTLASAADDHGVDVNELILALAAWDRDRDLQPMDWSRVPPSRLVDQLDREHTTFMSELFLPAQGVLERVSLREADAQPEIVALCDRFTALESLFVNHFDDEEHGVFLACRAIDSEGHDAPADVSELLPKVAFAHRDIVAELAEIDAMVEAIDLDVETDEDWKQFLLAFRSMERALRRHMHCEEFILPRSVEAAR
jgi:iron-sulfur cluster repair protein YtfE (RIC family)